MVPGERRIATAFIVSTLGALGLATVYVRGGQPQLEGALLAVSMGGLGVGLILWAKYLLPTAPVIGEREALGSSPEEREAFEASFERGELELGRRTFLSRRCSARSARWAWRCCSRSDRWARAPGARS